MGLYDYKLVLVIVLRSRDLFLKIQAQKGDILLQISVAHVAPMSESLSSSGALC